MIKWLRGLHLIHTWSDWECFEFEVSLYINGKYKRTSDFDIKYSECLTCEKCRIKRI